MNTPPHPDRRSALKTLGVAALAAVPGRPTAAAATPGRSTGMGLVIYDCNIRRKAMRQQNPQFDLFEPMTFLKHCHALGAGGMQVSLRVMEPEAAGRLRDYAAEHELYIDGIINPPTDEADLARFEAEVATAKAVGVNAVRTVVLPGRRYERFKTLAEFREFERRAERMLELAAPVVEKHRVRFAVENHKGQRIDERLALYKKIDSEYVGACVDTGNSFALLDDPYGAIEALAPYAFTVHLKDQALTPTDDGFLLADIPLGRGSFDLGRMVNILKKAKPDIKFGLELITRDALRVPCLSDGYWATMSHVPGRDLARTLRFVHDHPANGQAVSALPAAEQLKLEDANVAASIEYARKDLSL